MLRGFYNSAQAMIVNQRILDAVSNNISNINTSGYRKDRVVTNTFMEELILVQGRRETSGTFLQTYADSTKADLEQSNFEYTENRYDMAIWGNVYFNVRTSNDAVYQTRNGQFELDGEGYLTLNKVGRVQGQNGDIYLGNDDFIVDPDGVIYNDNGVVDTLLLTYIPPDADVAKIGDNLFSYEGGEEFPEGEVYDIIQGAFEKSNVDGNEEVIRMMEVQRMFEANSTVLKQIDQINSKSATIAGLAKNG